LTTKKFQHEIHDGICHFFGSMGARVYVTMEASLVASIPNIDLQRFKLAPANGGKRNSFEQWKRFTHWVPRYG
jgi:hypothetical protein